MPIVSILKHLGLSEKEIQTYLSVLKLGPSPVRKISEETKINRGTTYDILKSLIGLGLLSYYHKDKHQYFTAEDPEKLKDLLKDKQNTLSKLDNEINRIIPELKSIYNKAGEKPVVKYYEGLIGIKVILQDLLKEVTEADEKEYYVYSSANIRQYLYEALPDFTKQRIKKKIKVKVIALGSGGELHGLDQRKWLSKKEGSPTYILIYKNKTALISVDYFQNPLGVIIEDEGITQTQKVIFSSLWSSLK